MLLAIRKDGIAGNVAPTPMILVSSLSSATICFKAAPLLNSVVHWLWRAVMGFETVSVALSPVSGQSSGLAEHPNSAGVELNARQVNA